MIEEVHLENFKNHADTTIELGRLTALVGPNGTGKTSVLKAVHRLSVVARKGQLKHGIDLSKGRDELIRWGADTLSISAQGTAEDERWLFRITIPPETSSPEEQRAQDPDLVECEWGINHSSVDRIGEFVYPSDAVADRFRTEIGGARYYRLSPDRMRDASKMNAPYGRLSTDGHNLASVLAYCMTTEQDRYRKIKSLFGSILPSVTGIRTQPDGSDQYELLFDTASGEGIGADHISEGALVVLGVATAITGMGETEDSRLVLLDGLERSLHPRAQRDLVHLLRNAVERHSDVQLLLTTHSPYIVDELSPEEVYLLNTDEAGIAHTNRLSQHPDADRALDLLTTGEFWSAEGEEWVLDRSSGDGQPVDSDERDEFTEDSEEDT